MKHKVDLVISSHIHDYERSHRLFSFNILGTSVKSSDKYVSPVYIVHGHSGNGFDFITKDKPGDSHAMNEIEISGKNPNF